MTLYAEAGDLLRINNVDAAVDVMLRIGADDPDYPDAQIMLGAIAFERGQWQQAEDFALSALRCSLAENARYTAQAMLEAARKSGARSPAEITESQFDVLAADYNKWHAKVGNTMPRDCANALSNALHQTRRKAVVALDLCCGTGQVGSLLRKLVKGITLTGADLSTKSLEIARKTQAYNELVAADVGAHDFGANRFDAVIMVDALMFFSSLGTVFNSVAHSLKTNGYFCFNLAKTEQSRSAMVGGNTHYHYASGDISEAIKAAGLKVSGITAGQMYIEARQGFIPAQIYVLRK